MKDYPWSQMPQRVMKELVRAVPGTEIERVRDQLYREEWGTEDNFNPLMVQATDTKMGQGEALSNQHCATMMCRWLHSDKRLVHVSGEAKVRLAEVLYDLAGIRWSAMMVDCPPHKTYKHGVMLSLREGPVVSGSARDTNDRQGNMNGWSAWPSCVVYIEPCSIHDPDAMTRGPLVSVWWRNYDMQARSFKWETEEAQYETYVNPWRCAFHGHVDDLWWRGQGQEYLDRHPFTDHEYEVFDVDDNIVGGVSLPHRESLIYGHPAGYAAQRYMADLEQKHGPCYVNSRNLAIDRTSIRIPHYRYEELTLASLQGSAGKVRGPDGQAITTPTREIVESLPGFEGVTLDSVSYFNALAQWPCTQMIALACSALSAILTEDKVLLPPPKRRGRRTSKIANVGGAPAVRNLTLSEDALAIVTKKRGYGKTPDDQKGPGSAKGKGGPRKPPTGDAPLQHVEGFHSVRWVLEENIQAGEIVIADGETSPSGKPLFAVSRPVSGGPDGEGYTRGEVPTFKNERLKTGIDDFDALTPVT